MNSENNSKKRKKKKWKIGHNFCYDFVKVTGAIPVLLWMRPKLIYPEGKPRMRGAMLVSANHNSFLDPIIVHCVFKWRRLNCLATKELYNTKRKARFFNLMHCIKADKENFSLSSFHTVVERLGEGKVVVIFPEGRVNRDQNGGMLAFKSGAALMAHKSGAPILPIYIVKKEKWYQRQRIVVGQPLDIHSILGDMPTLDQLSTASDLLREREIRLYEYYEERYEKKKNDIDTPKILNESEKNTEGVYK